MVSNYKRLLDDINKDKPSVTPEQIERCRINEIANQLRPRQEELKRKQKALATKMGMSYVEWLKQARTYYKIDPETFTVTSNARSPDKTESWECPDLISAEEKILELINYKYQDHFVKGHDFAW